MERKIQWMPLSKPENKIIEPNGVNISDIMLPVSK